jgi:hypothetical protein
MDVLTAAILVAIGIAAGMVASMVGGAAAIVEDRRLISKMAAKFACNASLFLPLPMADPKGMFLQ